MLNLIKSLFSNVSKKPTEVSKPALVPQTSQHINNAGISLVKSFEGKELRSYQDSVGVWTIGYGHTNAAGLPHVQPGMEITEQEAIDILKTDLVKYEDYVKRLVEVTLNDNQFAALVSFCYNVGPANLKSSTLLKKINSWDFVAASREFAKWNKAGGEVLPGLTRRREAERQLFVA